MRRGDRTRDICVHFLAALTFWCLVPVAARAQTYTFTRWVGSDGGRALVDGTGSNARFNYPEAIVRDGAGNLYVSDRNNHVIRKITPAGVVTTFAGGAGSFAQDGLGSGASFSGPAQLARDSAGNIYVADTHTSTIRKITPAGLVTTIAGRKGIPGADNGPVASATFNWPMGIAVNGDASIIYVAEYRSHTIRKIAGGTVTTFAGTSGVSGTSSSHFYNPVSLALDPAGNLYVADSRNYAIRKITSAGVVSNYAGLPGSGGNTDAVGTNARFLDPQGLALDTSGNLWVSDFQAIRKIDTGRVVTTIAGGTRGDVDGVGLAAAFLGPAGLTYGSDGNLYICNRYGGSIRKMTGAAVVSTIAGKVAIDGHADGALLAARFTGPTGLATDTAGNLYVADRYSRTLRKVTPAGSVSTIAGQAFSIGDGNGTPGQFNEPFGVAVDGGGNVYVTEYGRHTIRKVTAAGAVSTLAGSPGLTGTLNGTGSAARFNKPFGVAIASGHVFVTDQLNHTIRKITTDGVVTTFAGTAGVTGTTKATGTAARFNKPSGIARDSDNNLFVADYENHTIRKITTDGVVTTFAGSPGAIGSADGPAEEARFYFPHHLAVDASDNVFVTEANGTRVRKITPAGDVTTVGGTSDILTMDGTGAFARFMRPTGIVVAPDGTLYVSEPDYLHAIVRGKTPALSAVATIDDPSGAIHVTRQLSATPASGTAYLWRQIRKPSNSTAALSSASIANPTFTPDVPARYDFELDATSASARSITRVTLDAQCASSMTIGPASLPDAMAGASYSATISVGGGTGPYLLTTEGSHPGLTLSSGGLLSGTVSAGYYGFTVKASDSIGCRAERYYSFTVYPYPAPTGLVADGSISSAAVFLTWNAVPGAAGYRIYRRSPGTWYTLVGEQPGASHSDFDVSANKAYLYLVRARDGSGNETQDSNIDLATTIAFTDASLSGVTVKAQHLLQLRQAVNAMRALSGDGPWPFTDAALTGLAIKGIHLTELRTQLNVVRGYLALPSIAFTDDPLGAARPVKAIHINQLRNGVK